MVKNTHIENLIMDVKRITIYMFDVNYSSKMWNTYENSITTFINIIKKMIPSESCFDLKQIPIKYILK